MARGCRGSMARRLATSAGKRRGRGWVSTACLRGGLDVRCKKTREEGARGRLIEKWHHLSRESPDEDPAVEIGVSIVSTGGLVST
jgi:hypothetical protein